MATQAPALTMFASSPTLVLSSTLERRRLVRFAASLLGLLRPVLFLRGHSVLVGDVIDDFQKHRCYAIATVLVERLALEHADWHVDWCLLDQEVSVW